MLRSKYGQIGNRGKVDMCMIFVAESPRAVVSVHFHLDIEWHTVDDPILGAHPRRNIAVLHVGKSISVCTKSSCSNYHDAMVELF